MEIEYDSKLWIATKTFKVSRNDRNNRNSLGLFVRVNIA